MRRRIMELVNQFIPADVDELSERDVMDLIGIGLLEMVGFELSCRFGIVGGRSIGSAVGVGSD